MFSSRGTSKRLNAFRYRILQREAERIERSLDALLQKPKIDLAQLTRVSSSLDRALHGFAQSLSGYMHAESTDAFFSLVVDTGKCAILFERAEVQFRPQAANNYQVAPTNYRLLFERGLARLAADSPQRADDAAKVVRASMTDKDTLHRMLDSTYPEAGNKRPAAAKPAEILILQS